MREPPNVGDQILFRYLDPEATPGMGWVGRITVDKVIPGVITGFLDKVRESSGFVDGMHGGWHLDDIEWTPWLPLIEEDPL